MNIPTHSGYSSPGENGDISIEFETLLVWIAPYFFFLSYRIINVREKLIKKIKKPYNKAIVRFFEIVKILWLMSQVIT